MALFSSIAMVVIGAIEYGILQLPLAWSVYLSN